MLRVGLELERREYSCLERVREKEDLKMHLLENWTRLSKASQSGVFNAIDCLTSSPAPTPGDIIWVLFFLFL